MRDTATIEEPKFARFLFASTGAAWIWLIARVWLGYQWLHAGWEKIAGYSPVSNWDWQWHFTSASWLKSRRLRDGNMCCLWAGSNRDGSRDESVMVAARPLRHPQDRCWFAP